MEKLIIDLPFPGFYESMLSGELDRDRAFAYIKPNIVRRLFAMSRRDKHDTLDHVIKERHTSRSGFHSWYNNELDSWLAKPVLQWDHNELGTLFLACLEISGEPSDRRGDGIEWRVYEDMSGSGDFFTALDQANDWTKFKEAVNELRACKEAELRADDPEYVPPTPRCPDTRDMFRA